MSDVCSSDLGLGVADFCQEHVGIAETVQTSTVTTSSSTVAPATRLVLGAPFFVDASSRVFVSTASLLSFAVDDHANGIAFSRYRLDGSSFLTYTSSFTLLEGT